MTVLAALRRSPRGAVLRTRFIFQRHLKSATACRRALIEKEVGIEPCFDFAQRLQILICRCGYAYLVGTVEDAVPYKVRVARTSVAAKLQFANKKKLILVWR